MFDLPNFFYHRSAFRQIRREAIRFWRQASDAGAIILARHYNGVAAEMDLALGALSSLRRLKETNRPQIGQLFD